MHPMGTRHNNGQSPNCIKWNMPDLIGGSPSLGDVVEEVLPLILPVKESKILISGPALLSVRKPFTALS